MKVFRFNNSLSEEEHDKQLRDALKGHSVTPPSYIWDNVEERLPAEQKNRRGIIFWLMPVAASVIVLAAFFPYIMLRENTSGTHISKVEKMPSALGNYYNSADGGNAKIPTKNNAQQLANVPVKQNSKSHIRHGRKIAQEKIKLVNYIYEHTEKYLTEWQAGFGNNENTGNELKLTNQKFISENNKYPHLNLADVPEIKVTEKTFAQFNSVKQKPSNNKFKSKWILGLEYGIGTSYRTITPQPSPKKDTVISIAAVPEKASNDYNSFEKAGESWRLALNGRWQFHENWSVKSAVAYTQYSLSSMINVETVYPQNPSPGSDTIVVQKNSAGIISLMQEDAEKINTKQQTGNYKLINSYPINYSFGLIEIPLQVRFQHKIKGKFGFYTEAGPQIWFLSGKKAVYVLDDGTRKRTEPSGNYNKIGLGATASAGLLLNLNNHLQIDFGPGFTTSLTTLNTSNNSNIKPYNYLLSTSINYKF